jgi:ribosomal protein L29
MTEYTNEELFEAGTKICKFCNERKLLSTQFWHKKRNVLNLSKCGSCISKEKTEYYRKKRQTELYKPLTEVKLKYHREYYKNNKVKIECPTCNISLYRHNLAKHETTQTHKNKITSSLPSV